MSNRHLINQQKISLRMADHQEALKVQQEISSLYWQQIVPAFEGLFDRVAGPDVLVKLNILEIDLGNISRQDLYSPLLVDEMLRLLEAAILKAIQEDQVGNVTKPIHLGQFQLWLYFLEHGYLPSDSAFPKKPLRDWYNNIFEALARDGNAIDHLCRLVSTCPQAMERLIIQYDPEFLQQIVVLFTGFEQNQLTTQISGAANRIVEAIQALLEDIQKERRQEKEIEAIVDDLLKVLKELIPSLKTDITRQAKLTKKLIKIFGQNHPTLVGIIEGHSDPDFLRLILKQADSLNEIQATSSPILQLVTDVLTNKRALRPNFFAIDGSSKERLLRQIEINEWRLLLIEVLVQGNKAATEKLLKNILPHKTLQPWWFIGEENIKYINEKIKPFNYKKSGLKGKVETRKILPPEIPENPIKEALAPLDSNFFYIPQAGMILLHPFLSTFFQKLELTKDTEFTDSWQHQKAILLLHFLATGEEKGSEFDLVLPKHLSGWPLNLPIDHAIKFNPEEKAEGEKLLQAVIDHWGALGSTSMDGLREGFLQREGKLEKKPNGWLLRVEQKTMDILLDRLPWNLSLIKLPWMEDMLRVDWK